MTQEIKRTPSQLSIRLLSFTTHLCEFCYLRVGTSGPCSRQLMQWRLHIYLTYHHMDSLRILSRYCQQYSPQSARWSPYSACRFFSDVVGVAVRLPPRRHLWNTSKPTGFAHWP